MLAMEGRALARVRNLPLRVSLRARSTALCWLRFSELQEPFLDPFLAGTVSSSSKRVGEEAGDKPMNGSFCTVILSVGVEKCSDKRLKRAGGEAASERAERREGYSCSNREAR